MKYAKILLTGASGTLGSHIQKSGLFPNLLTLSVDEVDITDSKAVERFFSENEYDAVIHCAALARMKECEADPGKAINANIIGTSNVVTAVLKKEEKTL